MQKLIKRTAEAQRSAARRAKKKSFIEYREARESRKRAQKGDIEEIAQDLKQARLTRRENWELGPMAPRRNLDAHMTHAATDTSRFSTQTPLKTWEIEKRCAWAGGPKYLNLAIKDRVVVTEGPFKGAIDYIDSIDKPTATVKLLSAGKYLAKIPEYFRGLDEASAGRVNSVPASIPISAIRLVHPLTDPNTGVTRDVIVRHLTTGPVKWHRHTSWRAWERYITGQNVAVPWPERDQPKREDQPADTVRAAVEEPTFVPTLLRCPVPPALIDELRNRYSKFRTRHEEDFVLRKEQEEAERMARRNETERRRAADAAGMLTPLQQLNRQQRALRRAKGQPMLSEDMQDRIGQVIARNKADALREAGLSEVKETTQ